MPPCFLMSASCVPSSAISPSAKTREKVPDGRMRVHHDLYYIENWSIFLDIYIVFMTPFSLLKSENAY